MPGAQTIWHAHIAPWFFWINAIVCLALLVTVVRTEKKYRSKIKELEDTLDDSDMLNGPNMMEKRALRLRIEDMLKKHGVEKK
jgi:hypothetical protein